MFYAAPLRKPINFQFIKFLAIYVYFPNRFSKQTLKTTWTWNWLCMIHPHTEHFPQNNLPQKCFCHGKIQTANIILILLEIIQNALVGKEYCLLHTVQYTGYTSLFNEVFLGYESICIIYSSMLCFLHDFILILI